MLSLSVQLVSPCFWMCNWNGHTWPLEETLVWVSDSLWKGEPQQKFLGLSLPAMWVNWISLSVSFRDPQRLMKNWHADLLSPLPQTCLFGVWAGCGGVLENDWITVHQAVTAAVPTISDLRNLLRILIFKNKLIFVLPGYWCTSHLFSPSH